MRRFKILLLPGFFLMLQMLPTSRTSAGPLFADPKQPLTFSGTLETRQTQISAEVVARVTNVRVDKGDRIQAGDVLVELDDSSIKMSLTEAESAVSVAQANLDQVKEPARPGSIALAEAGLAQAQANLNAARAALDDAKRALASPQDISSQLHQWEGKVLAATNDVEQAQAAIGGANNQLLDARNDQSMLGKFRIASLEHQRAAGEWSLQAAKANLAASQQVVEMYLKLLQNPLELAAAKNAAEKQVDVAQSDVQAAQAELDWVRRKPQTESVALAQAKLAAAQANQSLVERQAKRYIITSPISGIVLERGIDAGETTRAGSNVMTLGNSDELQLTLYLPLSNMNSVRIGQTASVHLPSLPGKTFSGKVSFIASQAEFKPANLYDSENRSELVFAVRVTIPNGDQDLKAGLPADATLQ